MWTKIKVWIVLATIIVGINSSGLPPHQGDEAYSPAHLRSKALNHVGKALLKGSAVCTVGGTVAMANCPQLYQAINRGDYIDATVHGANVVAGLAATAAITPAVMSRDIKKAKSLHREAAELDHHGRGPV